MWRRRALLRKGARLYSNNAWTGIFVSLAMLDEDGVVIGWYESANDWDGPRRSPMQNHVAHLYTVEDVALGVPFRDLCTATTHGESMQIGWRMGIDGRRFWATTTIRAVFLRDGRLQGYSHLTERLPTPWRIADLSKLWRGKRPPNPLRGHEPRTPDLGATFGSRVRTSRSNIRSSGAAAALWASILLSPSLAAGAAATEVPENARPSDYGPGWDCTHGYRRVRDACEQINVPSHGYLDASGNRWRCDRGYLSVEQRCAKIDVPAHAYLDDSYGTGWRCERGYREAKGACTRIQIPVNAHEVDSSYGAGWACDRGFALRSGICQAVTMPANAFLTRSGEEWKCDRGYAQANDSCVPIDVPKHGYVDAQGNGWSCERGFAKAGLNCEAIKVPANAHLDYTGDRWRCNRGFNARAGYCLEDQTVMRNRGMETE